jgi:hypothetical protein
MLLRNFETQNSLNKLESMLYCTAQRRATAKEIFMAIIALVFLIGTAAWTLLNAFEG